MSINGKRGKWLFHIPILFVLTFLGKSLICFGVSGADVETSLTVLGQMVATTTVMPFSSTKTNLKLSEMNNTAITSTTTKILATVTGVNESNSSTPKTLSVNDALTAFATRFRSTVSDVLKKRQVRQLTVDIAEILTDPSLNNTIAYEINAAFLDLLRPNQRVRLYTALKCSDTNIGTMGTALLLLKIYELLNPIMVPIINALRINVVSHNLVGSTGSNYAILAIEAGFTEKIISQMFSTLESSLDIVEARVLVNCGGSLVYFSKYMQPSI